MCVATNRMDCASIRIDDAGASLRSGYATSGRPSITLCDSPTAQALEAIVELDLLTLAEIDPPEATAVIRSHEMTPQSAAA